MSSTATLWTPPRDLVLPDEVDLDRVVPRVCMFPDYAYSSGVEAIELAASAGLILDPWQQLVLQLGLGETAAGKWAAFQVALIVARQNGKGAVLEALELFWLFVTGEQLIGHSAHEYKTAMEAFRRVISLITNSDELRKKVKKIINTNGEEGIELLHPSGSKTMTGQRLRFMARSKGAGRGFSFNKLIWDEAYALTEEQQAAQLPTLSAMLNPQIWLTSSPPLDAVTGGALFRLRRQAEAHAKGLTFLDYGLAGSLDQLERIDLDDPDAARRANPADRVTMEAMGFERISMSDVSYARERLGIWPPDLSAGFTVISEEQWDALCDPLSGKEPEVAMVEAAMLSSGLSEEEIWAAMLGEASGAGEGRQLKGKPAFAVYTSPRTGGQVRSSIAVARRRVDGKAHIEVIQVGQGTVWIVPALKALADRWEDCIIVIDPGAPAGSVIADAEAIELEIVKMTSRDVAAAFGLIYDAATGATPEDRVVVHIGQQQLKDAVAGATTRPVGDGTTWDTRNAAVDITGLAAVTHALWGLANYQEEAEPMVTWST